MGDWRWAWFIVVVIQVHPIVAEIRQPPVITTQPESQDFTANAKLTLKCSASGNSPILYAWKLNETIYLVGNQTSGDYVISSATSANNGYYVCYATNIWGTAISRTALIQQSYITSFTDVSVITQYVKVGNWTSFSCRGRPTSLPTALYSWYRELNSNINDKSKVTLNNRVQVNDLDGTLYFANLLLNDTVSTAITFACGASIEGTTVYGSKVNLSLLTEATTNNAYRPAFKIPAEESPVVLEGQKVTLKCFFTGLPTPVIKWYRNYNDQLQPEADSYNTTYVIQSVQPSDKAAVYSCHITDSTVSQLFRLDVQAIPEFRDNMTSPANTNVTVGDDASFLCNPYAVPTAEISWYINGTQLDVNNLPSRYSLSEDKTNLTISNVCLNCSGGSADFLVVTCNASNQHGYVLGQAYLNVLDRTAITKAPVDMTAAIGQSATFDCRATTDQITDVTFTWLFNGTEITQQPNVIYYDCSTYYCQLQISRVQESNYGLYTCVASNGYSKSETSAFLYVTPGV